MNIADFLNRMTMGRALIIGLAIAGLYYFMFFDSGAILEAQNTALESQKNEKEIQLKAAQAKIDRAIKYKNSVAEMGETLKKLLSTIPEKFESTDLMRIVSNEVKVAGSSLVGITSQPNSNRGNQNESTLKEFEEISVTVDVQGAFNQHMILLSNLTKVKQILTVQKLNLESVTGANANEPTQVKMSATILAYRYLGQVQ